MSQDQTYVVVGGGLAAAKAVEGMREAGYQGRIVLIGAESHLPYERPPLSKGYLLGNDPLDGAFVHHSDWYVEHDVELRLGTLVTGIDVAEHTVSTGGGLTRYDRLLLATGATPRRLGVVDDSGVPAAYLRTIEDSDRLKSAFAPWQSVVVVGGGWIGLEAAAAARTAGAQVVVVEAAAKPLHGVLGDEVAEVFATLHRDHGVDLRTGVSVASVQRRSGGSLIGLDDGSTLEADLVVVGVGVAPEVSLAEEAGLATDNGVVVDQHLRTSDPDVFAAGDLANAFHPTLGRHLRVEHWDTAIGQGLAAGRNMAGREEPYDRLPYFFTDQYDFGMEYVGSVGPDGYDEVIVRGDTPARVFTAFWVRDGAVVAGMHANDWDAIDPVRSLVEKGNVDLGRLRDSEVALDDVSAG